MGLSDATVRGAVPRHSESLPNARGETHLLHRATTVRRAA